METRSKPFLVGLFALLLVAAGFVFIGWLQNFGDGSDRKPYYIVFAGSIQGLSQGSPVYYNGLKVGEVTGLGLNPEKPSEVRALIEIDRLTSVKVDTRVILTYQGVTGIASIELLGGSPWKDDVIGVDADIPTLFGEQSGLQNMLSQVEVTLGLLNTMLESANKKLQAIDDVKIASSVDNIEKFTAVLGDNADDIDAVIDDFARFSRELADVSEKVSSMMAIFEGDGSSDNPGIAEQAKAALTAIGETARTLEVRTRKISQNLNDFTDQGLKDVQELVRDGRESLQSMQRLMRDVEKNPQQFLFGKDRIPDYPAR